MSSRSDRFECHWRPSQRLLALYLILLGLAVVAPLATELPGLARLSAWLACAGHALWCLPRHVLLSTASAFKGLRLDMEGWQLWRSADGWQPAQLCQDSVALPFVVVLRFRLVGERRIRGVCIPADALDAEQHRRLRVQLKFSRRRWAVPE